MMVSLRRGLAAAIAVLTIGSVQSATSAGAPPTVPPDFVSLIDDTGNITVQVPGSWSDVDTAQDGVFPSIEASTDLEAYHDTFDVAGVHYRAAPFNADTEGRARAFIKEGCVDEEVVPYDDGVFAGTRIVLTGCGVPTSTSEVHVVAANPADQSFTAQLRIQITGPADYPILDGILATFNVASEPGSAGTTVPATSSVPPTPTTVTGAAGAFPPPSGSVPADWTGLVDDTQTISIRVPSDWTATETVPAENSDGTQRPWISATTDQESFFPPAGTADTFSVPGVVYQAAPFVADTAAELSASVYHRLCTADPMQTYDDGAFIGHIQFFADCGGTATRIVLVAANPADSAFTALVLVQLTGQPDDEATLDGLLSSFNRVTGSGAPTTVVASTDVATSDPAVAVLQQQLEQELGLVITDEQGSCLIDNFGDTDPNDAEAVFALLVTCGVDLSDASSG